MPLQAAITIPPHKEPGIILIGSPNEPVEEMEILEGYHLEVEYLTPEIASQVEDILLQRGYVVTSPWEYLIEFCTADISPIGGNDAR